MVRKQEVVLGAELWLGLGRHKVEGDEGSQTHPGGFVVGLNLQSQWVRFYPADNKSMV